VAVRNIRNFNYKNDTVLTDATDNFLLSRQLQANTTEAIPEK